MNLIARLTLAAALAVGAAAAHAAPVTAAQSVALQASKTSSTLTAGFTSVHTVAGEFVDTFTFTGASGLAMVNGSLAAIGSTQSLDIDFITALINGVSYTITRSALGGNPDGIEIASLLNTALTTPLVLTIHGYAGAGLAAGTAINASYSGTINVTQVPEPASMALAAVGLMGLVFTRRRKTAQSQPV
ncbi:PEP-CTERM protein-sorting domain-containing protein [Roseateles sp. YR242]|uniref:PEP-CTERM sorting domain-containing protein n=1 Tax=Roseateles sp. YR242 TaxID=1855305 RepID=UPI0008B43FEB|nr:PEP-CTERM sorting domain-containing protein [Roseateles sp. YR242]SEK98053.1 PEP-CTERM protein-sorting domain-containing protein [Roseateles sp. YR242]